MKHFVLFIFLSVPAFLNAQPIKQGIWHPKTGFLMTLDLLNIDIALLENKKTLEDYQERFDRRNYNLYRNNEFEMQAYNERCIAQIKKELAVLSYDTLFEWYTYVQFGTFDQINTGFPLNQLQSNTPLSQSSVFKSTPKICSFYNSNLDAVTINDFEFDFLPISKSDAEVLLRERTDSRGYINRTFFVTLQIQVQRIKNSRTDYKTQFALLHIRKATFFRDTRYNSRTIPLLTITSKVNLAELLQTNITGNWIPEDPANVNHSTFSLIDSANRTLFLTSSWGDNTKILFLHPLKYVYSNNRDREVIIIDRNRICFRMKDEKFYYKRKL